MPLADTGGEAYGALQTLNRRGGGHFSFRGEQRLDVSHAPLRALYLTREKAGVGDASAQVLPWCHRR